MFTQPPCINIKTKSIGTLLGCMCGDVLGACGVHAVFYDSHSALNLASLIVEKKGVDPDHVASRGYENSVAMGIPIGIAYKNAPLHVLHGAVRDACVGTHAHTHPVVVDAAFVLAAAIGWLLHRPPAVTYVEKRILQDKLLQYLVEIAQTDGMRYKLQLLGHRHVYIPESVTWWPTYLTSPTWQREFALQLQLSEENLFGMSCDGVVAAALCAFLHHGMTECCTSPQNTFLAACHYGGNRNTIASLACACWGALHGYEDLPKEWLRDLGKGQMGRFRAIEIGYHLVNVNFGI